MTTPQQLSTVLLFDNRNISSLPIDGETKIFSRPVHNAIYSFVKPTPLVNPKVVAVSAPALSLLGLREEHILSEEAIAELFSGNTLFSGSSPYAHCYCGHQFGSFAGQLGDGAAISLGEVLNPTTNERWEVQLKGAGPTPYSRRADGRKVLRSSIREFLCSEYMHFLGIPTTRAGALVASFDTQVARDPFYNGSNIFEPCAVVTRIAPHFFRLGSLEIFKTKPKTPSGYDEREGPSAGNEALRKQLVDHIISNYYSYILDARREKSGNDALIGEDYKEFFREVLVRTANLIAQWQSVGFVHGVLNSDNISLAGVTIDYGPYGFMGPMDRNSVSNGSDRTGRYRFCRQPEIGIVTLNYALQMLLPLIGESYEALEPEFRSLYFQTFEQKYSEIMSAKVGFEGNLASDKDIFDSLIKTMEATFADFTETFEAFTFFVHDVVELAKKSDGKITSEYEAAFQTRVETLIENLTSVSATPSDIIHLFETKFDIHKLQMDPKQIYAVKRMSPSQLSEVFRGAPIEAILEEVDREHDVLELLQEAYEVTEKYSSQEESEKRDLDRNQWADFVKSIYIPRLKLQNIIPTAESPVDLNRWDRILENMKSKNPTFVLRNWILQDAIESAGKGDFDKVKLLLELCQNPYDQTNNKFFSNIGSGSNSDAKASESSNATCRTYTTKEKYVFNIKSSDALSIYCTCSS